MGPVLKFRLANISVPARWITTLSTNVFLPHAIKFKAVYGFMGFLGSACLRARTSEYAPFNKSQFASRNQLQGLMWCDEIPWLCLLPCVPIAIIWRSIASNCVCESKKEKEREIEPTPQTPNPQTSTLNPQPSTLNPQPSTLNPKP